MSFDAGFAELLRLISEEAARDADDRNEAQTRFDVIDRVLKDVLGWPAENIKVEQHVDNGGYTDYELVDSATIAVVEAKREGVGFTLPHDSAAGACSLVPLVGEAKNSALKQALQQVMGYAAQRGVGPCIATNGNQWIAFLGSRSDGVAPLAGRALVYPSLAAIRDNFVVFHNCLSVDGLLRREIYTATSVGVAAPPATLAASIPNYPGIKRRNVVQTNLQILGQIMLEDMPQEEQYSELFLRECYASSGALSSYAEISKELLTSRNAALLAESGIIEQPATVRRGVNPILSDEALAAAASHRPIVLLGGVGSGKSTFIQHLVAVDAQAVFQDAIAVTVDYGRGATFKSPTEFAVIRILEELLERHDIDVDDASFVEDVYRRDLERFDKGIAGRLKDVDPRTYALRRLAFLEDLVADRDEHLKRSISRIVRTRRRQVVIFLDNVDQREHSDQNQVFLAANELAATWEATVFVTLRPETYFESQRYGAVSGYHPRVFTISPPRTDVMLQKRVDFALRVLEGGQDVRTTKGGLGVESQSLELFLRVLDANFRGNRALMALIDNLAGGNMRKALDFVTEFIGSGHVDTQKIIGAEEREPGQYVIPIHEFLRSLMHGDNEYYDPSTSPIPNLFSLERPDRKNHFILPIALDYILSRGEARDGAGFVDLRDVFQHLQDLGYPGDVSAHALSYLGRYRLVEAPRSDADIATADRARITTVGAYCLRNLPRLFTYCDAIIVDTPILDRDVRAQVMDARTMNERVERATLFRSYLDEAWEQSALVRSNWGWAGVSESLGQDIAKVAGRLARSQPRA